MIRTNQYGIPDAIVKAVEADPYDRGDADFSVTDLIKPPQIRHLWEKHGDEVSMDVRDEVWRLLGQGVHAVLERAGEGVTEERLFATVENVSVPDVGVNTYTISGQVDLRTDSHMTDYKVTSVYSYAQGLKPEWEQQVNIYAWLANRKLIQYNAPRDRLVISADIVMILRDWMISRADRDPSYPNSPIQVVPVPIWPKQEVEDFIRERIALHADPDVRPCTDEERWARGGWLHKPAKGRSKTYATLAEASTAWSEKGGEITEKEKTYVRCASWCDVADFCPQFAAHKENESDD